MAKAKTAEKHDLLPNQKTAPMTIEKSGPGPFKGSKAGEKRAGSNKYACYPGEPTAPAAYCGGTTGCS